jgi:hypothetical protein
LGYLNDTCLKDGLWVKGYLGLPVYDVVLRNSIQDDDECVGVVLKCIYIEIPGEIVSEDLIGVDWIPTPFGTAGIGVNGDGSVMVDGFKNSVVDGVGGGTNINDGLRLLSVFVLEEEQQKEDGDDDVRDGFHDQVKSKKSKVKSWASWNIPFEVGSVIEILEVAAPAVKWVEGFPIVAEFFD